MRVSVCGVCHTELDEIEGRTPPPQLPVVLGHQVVGRVAALGAGVSGFQPGRACGGGLDLLGVRPRAQFCRSGQENLCPQFRATGRDANGGYAEYMVVPDASSTASRTSSPMPRPRRCCARAPSATARCG